MTRHNLLLCFDAFGTLFNPKGSVVQQYAEVARKCGLSSFTDNELQIRLMQAIKDERRRNPNYGKATGLGATKWWTNVRSRHHLFNYRHALTRPKIIHETFQPFIPDQALPPKLVPALLHRFASKEGYDAAPGLVPALRALRRSKSTQKFDKLVIGVITNSDDRVPSILSSLGLNVSPARYGSSLPPATSQSDIDFHCMSYDVGVEKPDKRIFKAAEEMLSQITGQNSMELSSWDKIYVGDEYAKDVVGAANAGWNSVLLGADEMAGEETVSVQSCPSQSLREAFADQAALRAKSIQAVVSWLLGEDLKDSKQAE